MMVLAYDPTHNLAYLRDGSTQKMPQSEAFDQPCRPIRRVDDHVLINKKSVHLRDVEACGMVLRVANQSLDASLGLIEKLETLKDVHPPDQDVLMVDLVEERTHMRDGTTEPLEDRLHGPHPDLLYTHTTPQGRRCAHLDDAVVVVENIVLVADQTAYTCYGDRRDIGHRDRCARLKELTDKWIVYLEADGTPHLADGTTLDKKPQPFGKIVQYLQDHDDYVTMTTGEIYHCSQTVEAQDTDDGIRVMKVIGQRVHLEDDSIREANDQIETLLEEGNYINIYGNYYHHSLVDEVIFDYPSPNHETPRQALVAVDGDEVAVPPRQGRAIEEALT